MVRNSLIAWKKYSFRLAWGNIGKSFSKLERNLQNPHCGPLGSQNHVRKESLAFCRPQGRCRLCPPCLCTAAISFPYTATFLRPLVEFGSPPDALLQALYLSAISVSPNWQSLREDSSWLCLSQMFTTGPVGCDQKAWSPRSIKMGIPDVFTT